MAPARIGIIGLGTVGKAHLGFLLKARNAVAVAIADTAPAAKAHAGALNVTAYDDYRDMIAKERLDGAIVAVPSADHVRVALACIECNIAVLVEKPIADSLAAARRLCDAGRQANVPILVGHQRRHNLAVAAVKRALADGLIGDPVIATIMYNQLKPESYFSLEWRRQETAGGGPIMINLIHEIDLVRYLYGEIASLQAISSNALRHFEVEDTAAVLVRFENGALGTLSVSDTAVTPYTWDLNSGELDLVANSVGRVKRQAVSSHFFAGTGGSITLPDLRYFSYRGASEPGWMSELSEETLSSEAGNSYQAQIEHFAAVALREAAPLVSAEDGTRTLQATLAVKKAAETGRTILFDHAGTDEITIAP